MFVSAPSFTSGGLAYIVALSFSSLPGAFLIIGVCINLVILFGYFRFSAVIYSIFQWSTLNPPPLGLSLISVTIPISF